ncbi:hypothetical protein D3C80_168670 [compost metagenome]
MRRAQHKGRVVEGMLGQQGERFRRNLENLLALEPGDADVLFAQQIVFSLIFRQRKRFLINKRFSRHCLSSLRVKPPGVTPTVVNQNIMDIHG